MLNIIWPVFIIISFGYAIVVGNLENVNKSIFDSAESAVELSIAFLGTMCLWNGLMKIVQETTLIDKLTKLLNPAMRFLFPELKKTSKANKEMSMNIIANILGLGNAATPLGIRAMNELQKENDDKNILSNTMIMFIVLNTASLQLIPTTVIAIRTSLGSERPSAVIVPIWIATIVAAVTAVVVTMKLINYISNAAIPMVILVIILVGVSEKKKVYELFVEGAKEGTKIVFNIFPTLLGLFVAIGALRSSGILTVIINFMGPVTNILKIPNEIMPLALLRPISGSASMAVATDIMSNYGVDSKIRFDCIYYYGVNRNNFLYNCNIHKLRKN